VSSVDGKHSTRNSEEDQKLLIKAVVPHTEQQKLSMKSRVNYQGKIEDVVIVKSSG